MRVVLALIAAVAVGSPAFAAPRSIVSSETHKTERVGQCFVTSVISYEATLGPDTASEGGVILNDGHDIYDTHTDRGFSGTRVGDPVRLCVTKVPAGCPKGDTRGIDYRGLNKRTGKSWRGSDSPHECGGA